MLRVYYPLRDLGGLSFAPSLVLGVACMSLHQTLVYVDELGASTKASLASPQL